MVISRRAPLDLLWAEMPGRRRRATIPFAGSQLKLLENGIIGKLAGPCPTPGELPITRPQAIVRIAGYHPKPVPGGPQTTKTIGKEF